MKKQRLVVLLIVPGNVAEIARVLEGADGFATAQLHGYVLAERMPEAWQLQEDCDGGPDPGLASDRRERIVSRTQAKRRSWARKR